MDFSDENILKESLRSGNHQALAFLMDSYHQQLCSYAYTLYMDYELSKDVVQNVFIKLWEKRDQTNTTNSLRSFLYRSVYNGLVDHWRQNKRILTLELKHLEALTQMIENESEEELWAQIKLVNQEIQNLPPKCKETFLLSKKEGLTMIEIAEFMNVSKRTVESQMNKAFRILREKLSDKIKAVLFILICLFFPDIKNHKGYS